MHILIVRNNFNPDAQEASLLLEMYLHQQNISYTIYDTKELAHCFEIIREKTDGKPSVFDLAVVLGGDGTILRTASLIQYSRCPILGINFGHLGFMANPNDEGVISIVSAALAGDVTQEARTNLCIEVYCDDLFEDEIHMGSPSLSFLKQALPEEPSFRFFALNEVVISRGANGRIIHFDYAIAGSQIADLRGDGLIVSTATGSTGYALSVGGPLLNPSFHGLLVVPIAPHSLQSRPIASGPSDVVEIDLDTSSPDRVATLFVDGEMVEFQSPVRRVIVRPGKEPTLLMRYRSKGFYDHASQVFFGREDV